MLPTSGPFLTSESANPPHSHEHEAAESCSPTCPHGRECLRESGRENKGGREGERTRGRTRDREENLLGPVMSYRGGKGVSRL